MISRSACIRYPKKRIGFSSTSLFITICVLLFCVLFAFLLSLSPSPFQKVAVYKKGLNHTIIQLETLAQKMDFHIPEGIVDAAIAAKKGGIKYGAILRGECNSHFLRKLSAYRAAHPQDVIWREKLEEGIERLWIFLEEGSEPDTKFLEITAN